MKNNVCAWCRTGKPDWVRVPWKNRSCTGACVSKPDVVDGVRLKTPEELLRERRAAKTRVSAEELRRKEAARRMYYMSNFAGRRNHAC